MSNRDIDTFIFNSIALSVNLLAALENKLNSRLTKIEARGTSFPMTVAMLWIPEGVHVTISVVEGSINAGVWKPDNIEEYDAEYQERIAECEAIVEKVLSRLKKNEEAEL